MDEWKFGYMKECLDGGMDRRWRRGSEIVRSFVIKISNIYVLHLLVQ